MDLLDSLLKGRGCSSDGSLTRNPINFMVDSVFNSHIGGVQPGSYNGMPEEQGYYTEQSPYQPSASYQPSAAQNSYNGTGATETSYVGNNMNFNQFNDQNPGQMMMQQQQQQMMMMQQQNMMQMQMNNQMNGQMRGSYEQTENEFTSDNSDRYMEDYETRNELYSEVERHAQHQNEGGDQVEGGFDVSSEDALRAALEKAGHEGELSSKDLDKIWSTFGSELTINDPEYAGSSAINWEAERDRQQQEYNVKEGNLSGDYNIGDTNRGQSMEGYRKAWENLSDKLESKQNVYAFNSENKYMNNTGEKMSDTDHFGTGMASFEAGRIKEAILAFEAELQVNDKNSEAWRMVGLCHAENDEDKKAIVCLNLAIEKDPYNVDALLAVGTSYVNEMDSVRALDCLSAWVTHNPLFQGLKVHVDEYSDGSQIDDVMQLMLAALIHAPMNREVKVMLGTLYNISQDFESAIICFKEALAIKADYTVYNKLGATLANNNNSTEAVLIYAQALRLRPAYPRGWLNLGISFANLSNFEEASKAYVQALHLTPGARYTCISERHKSNMPVYICIYTYEYREKFCDLYALLLR
mmetsp:Transcript_10055/g.9763  ORF Transcript_10055/g.9763 Transcript_10055/m.9763 type:complete len:581 (+) Transcript_10055:87-1829(+)